LQKDWKFPQLSYQREEIKGMYNQGMKVCSVFKKDIQMQVREMFDTVKADISQEMQSL
jgi:hypothetical protein